MRDVAGAAVNPVWRLIVHGPADGFTNMAIDEAMLRARVARLAPPTVRFFRWSPPCVSLGYFQSAKTEVDLEACRRLGVDCVRRPTGGRAILHEDELTYSIVADAEDPAVSGNVLESYRKISRGLVLGLRALGVPAEMKPLGDHAASELTPAGGTGYPDFARRGATAACFDVPSEYEIAVAGRKLVGSAQTRQSGTILQHGAVLLEVDPLRTFTVLKPPAGKEREAVAEWFAGRVTSLREVLGRAVSFEELAVALADGFAAALGVVLQPGELSEEERKQAERLCAEKYRTAEWNLKW